MNLLGISAFYHDSAAALLQDDIILAAAQEERFSRKKHDPSFPAGAVAYCLDHAGLHLEDLTAVAFYDKPLLKFERLLETAYAVAPRGLSQFVAAMPVWLREKLFLRKVLRDELNALNRGRADKLKMLFPEHHLSHAASAFYPSPFERAAILTVDGVGEWATASIALGEGSDIRILREMHFPHSLGLLYSAFTYYLGFRVNSGEYKLMGLAPYGDPKSARTARFEEAIRSSMISLCEDGSLWLDPAYFRYLTGLRMTDDARWESLFGLVRRESEQPIEQAHCDLALAIQRVTEDAVHRMAAEAKRLTGADALCLAGGVALNCVANGRLLRSGLFDEIWIQAAAGDAGGALGAAYAARHIRFEQPRSQPARPDAMQHSLLGPSFGEESIKRMARRYHAPFRQFESMHTLCDEVAAHLAGGKAVGWFQGRMEFGPRALGARSILGDPRDPDMQRRLNLQIKYRESFRPFAPAVLDERAAEVFELTAASPYMLIVAPIRAARRKPVAENYTALPLRDKLYVERSDLPAITHVDFSARIQTVAPDQGAFRTLLERFEARSGCPALINTSFNVRGEPIVCTPEDAYRCFMRTEMDLLAIGNFLFDKREQPEWPEPKGLAAGEGLD